MKVTVFSNYFNHHQRPFAEETIKIIGSENFTFVATEAVSQARIQMGYRNMDKDYPFVLTTYDNEENKKVAFELLDTCDAVLIGSAPEEYLIHRLKTGKIVFLTTERYFKERLTIKRRIRNMLSAVKHIKRFEKYSNLLYLCMSAYTAHDVNQYANFKNRTYKWGYFTDLKRYDINSLLRAKAEKPCTSLLWVGRFLDWKHPEAAVLLAEQLRAEGYKFELNIIGSGEMEQQLRDMVSHRQLDDNVHMLGSMAPEKVRKHMERADVFLFTSDFNEGWGAVLNEAMNSGCAVVASHAIGAAPFLVKHRENGVIYRNGDQEALFAEVKALFDNPQQRETYGINAYKTISETWNAEVAAERLVKLIEEIKAHGSCDLFRDGPCSRAEIVENNWF